MTGIIVVLVLIAVIVALGVVAARRRRPVGPETADRWKIERDASRAHGSSGVDAGGFQDGPGW